MTDEKENLTIHNAITQSMMIGLPRAGITFFCGHPFDLLKTRMQADPKIISAIALAKNIVQTEGVKGFFTGGTVNFGRHALKTAYRDPIRGASTAMYRKYFPDANDTTISTAASFTMSTFDTIAMTPLEKCKVNFQTLTDPSQKHLITYIDSKPNGFKPSLEYFYRGVLVSWARSSLSWSTYLVPESKIRKWVIDASPRVANKNSAYPNIPLPELIFIGTTSGIVNGLCTLPFDAVKTKVQSSNYKGKATINEMWNIAAKLLAERGIFGLYRGAGPRLIQYGIVGIATEGVMQEVDKVWSKAIPKAP